MCTNAAENPDLTNECLKESSNPSRSIGMPDLGTLVLDNANGQNDTMNLKLIEEDSQSQEERQPNSKTVERAGPEDSRVDFMNRHRVLSPDVMLEKLWNQSQTIQMLDNNIRMLDNNIRMYKEQNERLEQKLFQLDNENTKSNRTISQLQNQKVMNQDRAVAGGLRSQANPSVDPLASINSLVGRVGNDAAGGQAPNQNK